MHVMTTDHSAEFCGASKTALTDILVMTPTEIQAFGTTVEIRFGHAIALLEAELSKFSARLQDANSGFGLSSEQIRLRHSDILYGYELVASFFGGNAILTRNAELVRLTLTGGRTKSDLSVITQTVENFCKMVEMAPETIGTVTMHAHASFSSATSAQEYFAQYKPKDFTDSSDTKLRSGGVIGFLRSTQWPYEIRTAIEPSLSFQDGAFVSFNSVFSVGLATAADLHTLVEVSAAATQIYGLQLAFPS